MCATLPAGVILAELLRGRARAISLAAWLLVLPAVVLVLMPGRGAPQADRTNLLIVTGDTLRARSMKPYGGPVATPAFDALAARGTRLDRYYASAPWTIPSLENSVRELCRGEIRYVDEALGNILRVLEDQGLRDNTIVMFSADHGEEILERGRFGHGHSLFQEQVHVPFAIAGPGIAVGRASQLLAAVDVVPTLAELFGLSSSPHWRGRSWAELLRGETEVLPPRPVFCQATGLLPASPEPLQAVVDGHLKLIRGVDTGEEDSQDKGPPRPADPSR